MYMYSKVAVDVLKLSALGWLKIEHLPAALSVVVRTLNPEKRNFNAPAIRKEFLSKFDKYNILAL